MMKRIIPALLYKGLDSDTRLVLIALLIDPLLHRQLPFGARRAESLKRKLEVLGLVVDGKVRLKNESVSWETSHTLSNNVKCWEAKDWFRYFESLHEMYVGSRYIRSKDDFPGLTRLTSDLGHTLARRAMKEYLRGWRRWKIAYPKPSLAKLGFGYWEILKTLKTETKESAGVVE